MSENLNSKDCQNVRIFFRGPLRVVDAQGNDITPKSTLRQALLCVLILSPNQTVSRQVLQSMFWANKDSKHSAGSLRQELFKLRAHFEPYIGNVVQATPNIVSLCLKKIIFVTEGDPGVELLEGLNVKLSGTEGFEDWLSLQRQKFDLVYSAKSSDLDEAYSRRKKPLEQRYSIGILPPQIPSSNLQVSYLMDQFLDRCVGLVTSTTDIRTFDLRNSGTFSAKLDQAPTHGATFLLFSKVIQSQGKAKLQIRLQDTKTKEIVFAVDGIKIDGHVLNVQAQYFFEVFLEKLKQYNSQEAPHNLLPWSALSALFSMKKQNIEKITDYLRQASDENAEGTIRCLYHFSQIFLQHEAIDSPDKLSLDQLIEDLKSVPISSSLRPLCETLIGYTAHMLLAENDFASFTIGQCFARAPNLALNLDHLAVLRLAQGDVDGAEEAYQQCISGSTLSSWRYSYEVTGSMIAMHRGDYKTSLKRANLALMQKPNFIGALRYAMVGFAMDGNASDAFLMRTRLLQLRPSYDFSEWLERFLQRSDPEFGNNVAITLRDYEVL